MNPRNQAATVKPLILNLYAFAVSFFFFLTNFSTNYIFFVAMTSIQKGFLGIRSRRERLFAQFLIRQTFIHSFVCLLIIICKLVKKQLLCKTANTENFGLQPVQKGVITLFPAVIASNCFLRCSKFRRAEKFAALNLPIFIFIYLFSSFFGTQRLQRQIMLWKLACIFFCKQHECNHCLQFARF